MTTFPLPRVLAPIDPPGVFTDERGTFVESWRAGEDIPPMVCGLTSWSRKRTLRGLHYQWAQPRALIVRCVAGEIWDVSVDIRKGTPLFGAAYPFLLLADQRNALYIPPGFAHGFYATKSSIVVYECSAFYDEPSSETLMWNDIKFFRAWPSNMQPPIVSAKDQAGKRLDEIEPIEV